MSASFSFDLTTLIDSDGLLSIVSLIRSELFGMGTRVVVGS